MGMMGFVRAALVAAGTLGLAGCITSPEEQEELRVAEMEERERLQAMIDAGECRERHRTGSRTRVVYECGEVPIETLEGTRETMRRFFENSGRCPSC